MRNWFENDIFKIKCEKVKNKHSEWKTPTIEELQNECWNQVTEYGTLNDIGKFCYDTYVYLKDLKEYKDIGLEPKQIQNLLESLNYDGNYTKLIKDLNQLKELAWMYEDLNK